MISKSDIYDSDMSDVYYENTDNFFEIPVQRCTCRYCGVVFMGDRSHIPHECVLCGHTSLNVEDAYESRPLIVIPFEVPVEEAIRDYKSKISWNPILPMAFKSRKRIRNIQKVFLPTYLVNANHKGKLIFLAGDKQIAVGDKGRNLVLTKSKLLYSININYLNILLNVCTKIDNRLFVNLCNYTYGKHQDFSLAAIKDAFYIQGNVETTKMGTMERERLSRYSINKVRKEINHSLIKLKNDNTSVVFYDAKEVLIPVYIINVEYRGKIYQYFMNGQSGYSYLKLPVGVTETIIFSIIVGGLIFLVSFLLIYYL